MLRESYSGKIKTYSIGFKDNPASELLYAKMMAERFTSEHHEYQMDGSEIEFLPNIVDYMGDLFSESGVMLNHSVMKMVGAANLPVVHGGDGNDQYFGAGIRETAWHYHMRIYGLKPFSTLFDSISDISLFDHDNLEFRIHFQNLKFLKVLEPEIFGLHDFQLKHLSPLGEIQKHPYRKKSHTILRLTRNFSLNGFITIISVILLMKLSSLKLHDYQNNLALTWLFHTSTLIFIIFYSIYQLIFVQKEQLKML